MKASHLGKVIEYFDPMQSLDEYHKDWYVDRPDNPNEEMKVLLLNDPSPLKMLFSGHIGSGKSSSLNCLAACPEIKARFFVVQFSVEKDLNIIDLTYTDLLLAIGKRLFDAGEEAFGLQDRLKSDLEQWQSEVHQVTTTSASADLAARGKIGAWFLSVVGTLKTGFSEKREFRQKFEPRVPELVEFINRIVRGIETSENAGGKKVLLVIEDLDKPPVDVSMDLFLSKGAVIIQPVCKIIFTVPTSVLYSGQIKVVQQNFPTQCVLPSFKVRDRNGDQGDGWEPMHEIVRRRLDKELIADDALNQAVEMSGGVTRELVRIIRAAALRSLVTRANSIHREHVDQAVNAMRSEYSDSLTRQEQLEILRAVHKSKKLLWNDQIPMLDLMHNLMILKYPNGPGWYEVNPIVRQLIGV